MVSVAQFIGNPNNSFALAMGRIASIGARPTFELQFNILQNQLLNQLADKIEDLNDTSLVNKFDAFLGIEQKRLERMRPLARNYENKTLINYKTINGTQTDLDQLRTLATGGDEAAFDSLLAKVSRDVDRLQVPNGYPIGFYMKDGLDYLRTDGIGIGSYASYADSTARQAAVSAVVTKLSSAFDVLTINIETAQDFSTKVLTKLTAVILQIEAALTADQASKIGEIQKLRDERPLPQGPVAGLRGRPGKDPGVHQAASRTAQIQNRHHPRHDNLSPES